jgi:hypothetical protein
MSYAYSYNTNSINKYESIQSDISDAYIYLEEEEAYNKALAEGLDIRSTQYDEDELSKSLTLDWND